VEGAKHDPCEVCRNYSTQILGSKSEALEVEILI